MTDDVNIGHWVPYAAKVSTAYKNGDEVAYLKTFSGDRIQVNSTNAILTIDGVERAFASSVPDGALELQEDVWHQHLPWRYLLYAKEKPVP